MKNRYNSKIGTNCILISTDSEKILQVPTRTFCRHFFVRFSCFKTTVIMMYLLIFCISPRRAYCRPTSNWLHPLYKSYPYNMPKVLICLECLRVRSSQFAQCVNNILSEASINLFSIGARSLIEDPPYLYNNFELI